MHSLVTFLGTATNGFHSKKAVQLLQGNYCRLWELYWSVTKSKSGTSGKTRPYNTIFSYQHAECILAGAGHTYQEKTKVMIN